MYVSISCVIEAGGGDNGKKRNEEFPAVGPHVHAGLCHFIPLESTAPRVLSHKSLGAPRSFMRSSKLIGAEMGGEPASHDR